MKTPRASIALVLSAVSLTTFAGTAAGAFDPPETRTQRPGSAGMGELRFVSGDALLGMTVKSPTDESLGSISDAIVDRGSGRIQHVILTSGSVLGLGGKDVVIPFRDFTWTPRTDKPSEPPVPTLSASQENIKAWPEFDRARWSAGPRDEGSLAHSMAHRYYEPSKDWGPFTDHALKDDARVEGKITRITRQPAPDGGETVMVTITPNDGPQREVVLGPSWFLAGNSVRLYRDDPVIVQTMRVERGDKTVMIARSGTIGSRDIVFYDESGRPYWTVTDRSGSDRPLAMPLVLLSEIDGRTVNCRGEQCGSVDDAIVESNSGRIAFLSIDPDQNVLGVADTKRLVPWSVAMSSADKSISMDASKQMLLNAPATPDSMSKLSRAEVCRSIYQAYDMPDASFENLRRDRPMDRRDDDRSRR